MERKIKKYERLLIKLMSNYIQERSPRKGFNYQLITDTKNHHFQVIRNGWDDDLLIHQLIFHFEVKADNKIWLWVNQTDIDVGQVLQLQGVPNSDIVLGFFPPYMREWSDYAVA
jgi:XisI protein